MPRHRLFLLPLSLLVSGLSLHGQMIISVGSPTTELANTLFIDEASTGGGDTVIIDETTVNFTESLAYGVGTPGTLSITGWGFAANANTAHQDALSVDLTFIYAGATSGFSDGDEVTIGTVSGIGYNYSGAGTYYVNFGENAISAPIDGAGDAFRIAVTVNDTDGGIVESIRFKTGTGLGVKFSIAGTYTPVPEPSTFAFIFGLVALGFLFLKRRKA